MATSRAEAFVGYVTAEIRALKDAAHNETKFLKAVEYSFPRQGAPPAQQLCSLAVAEARATGQHDMVPKLNELWLAHRALLDSAAGGTIDNRRVSAVFSAMDDLRSLLPTCGNRISADGSADATKKNRQQLPDSVDARDLARELERQLPRGGKSQKQIALEFTRGDEAKAGSLLRIIRKYPLLHDAVKAAANQADR